LFSRADKVARVEFADQVVGGVLLELLLRGGRHQRWMAGWRGDAGVRVGARCRSTGN